MPLRLILAWTTFACWIALITTAAVLARRTDDLESGFTLLGWTGPGWVGALWLVLLLTTIGLAGRVPARRATRWAWLWLVLLVPAFGVLAYFLLSGVLTRHPRPDPDRRGLTGGRSCSACCWGRRRAGRRASSEPM